MDLLIVFLARLEIEFLCTRAVSRRQIKEDRSKQTGWVTCKNAAVWLH